MATEPIISSSGLKPLTGTPAEREPKKDAPPPDLGPGKTEAMEVELIDRVEVSAAARQMAKVVADNRPKLQLSPQQLHSITTGRQSDV